MQRKIIIKASGKYGDCDLCGKYDEIGRLIITKSRCKPLKVYICVDCLTTVFIESLKKK